MALTCTSPSERQAGVSRPGRGFSEWHPRACCVSGLLERNRIVGHHLAEVSDVHCLSPGCAGTAFAGLWGPCGDRPALHVWAPTPCTAGVRGWLPQHGLAMVYTPGAAHTDTSP